MQQRAYEAYHSKTDQNIPSLDERERPVMHTRTGSSSMCVCLSTDHMVGKAWNEYTDGWNRSTLTDQVNPEGCPKN